MSWINSALMSVGVPVVCAGLAFMVVGIFGKGDRTGEESAKDLLVEASENAVAGSKVSKKKKNRRQKSKAKSSTFKVTETDTEDQNASDEDDAEVAEEHDDGVLVSEEDIMRLAAVSAHVKPSSIVKRTTPMDIPLASIAAVSDQKSNVLSAGNDSELLQEQGGWSRIPTKMEEVVGGLKQKIDALNRQLREQEEGRSKEQSDFETQQKKWRESDHDWRERVKALVQQVCNLENELTSLRANNQYLSEQCEGIVDLERRLEQLASVSEVNQHLELKISQLERVLKEAQMAKENAVNASTAIRSALESDLEIARCELKNARSISDSLKSELAGISNIRAALETSKAQLLEDLSAKKSEIGSLTHRLSYLEEANKRLEVDIQHTKQFNGQLVAELDETVEKLKVACEQKAYLEDAYDINNRYVAGVIGNSEKHYQEKAGLIQELVHAKKKLLKLAAST